LVDDFVVVAAVVQIPLQSVRIGLPGTEAVAGGDAVSIANKNRLADSQQGAGQKKHPKRNDQLAANVHKNSVEAGNEGTRVGSLRFVA
jgi:hypothetical protein